jgi:fumarate reductase subunit D
VPKPKTSKSHASPIILIEVFTASLTFLLPFGVLAARDNNIFILAIVISAILVLLVFDGVALALMRKTKDIGSNRSRGVSI